MHVSQAIESENIAVMGGGKAQAFQINASAHAFKILTDSLYSDKPLATVREVICNGWDSHKRAGLRHVPLEITINEHEFTVRDYGAGIPDDRVIPVFCTLFGTDKIEKDDETGGFGLGAKAPFAYSEGFTMTSRHNGIQTVYGLYIADEECDGAPACKVMAQVPTSEQGVTVTIPLKERSHQSIFYRHIVRTIKDGGMTAKVNGEMVEPTDYTGFADAGALLHYDERRSGLYVFYGDVIYPITHNSEIDHEIAAVSEFIQSGETLLIYAPPSSMTVTPSRESISYSPKTLKTLKTILKDLAKRIYIRHLERLDQEIARVVGEFNRSNIMWAYQERQHYRSIATRRCLGVEEIAEHHVRYRIFEGYDDEVYHKFRKRIVRSCRDHRNDFIGARLNDSKDTVRVQNRYWGRKFGRLANQLNLERKVNVKFAGYSAALRTFARPGISQFKIGRSRPTLMVVNNRTAALSSNTPGWGFVIIKPDASPDDLDALMAFAGANHLEFTAFSQVKDKTPKKAKPLKAEKLPKQANQYSAFECYQSHIRNGYERYYQLPVPKVEKPVAYIALGLRMSSSNPTAVKKTEKLGEIMTWCKENLPGVVVATNSKERDRLVKMGVPPLDQVLFDKVQAELAKGSRELLIFRAFNEGMINYQHRNFHTDYAIKGLMDALHRSGAQGSLLAFGIPRSQQGSANDKILNLMSMLAPFLKATRSEASRMQWPDAGETTRQSDLAAKFDTMIAATGGTLPADTNPITAAMLKAVVKNPDMVPTRAQHLHFYAKIIDASDVPGLTGADKDRFFGMIEAEIERVLAETPTTEGAAP